MLSEVCLGITSRSDESDVAGTTRCTDKQQALSIHKPLKVDLFAYLTML
jgi:hypothetical protein